MHITQSIITARRLLSVACIIGIIAIPSHCSAQELLFAPYNENISEPSTDEINIPNRKSSTYEVGYSASTFNDVKLSGSYGIAMTMLPWNLFDNLYAGFHFSPFNFNFGLSELTSDAIKLGPALGYYITPTIFIALPIVVICDVYFQNSETKTAWGMSFSPSIYAGSTKFGAFAGPLFSVGFQGNTKMSFGFRGGLYF